MDTVNTLKSAFIAGICIGVAGIGFLATRDIVGSVLFAFALLTVVAYKLKLYTGTAGFIKKGEVPFLLLVFAGNILGCLAMSMLARLSPMPLQEAAQSILQGRLNMGPLHGGLLSIACGFIMTTAVTFSRKGNNLPLLFGVPLFITCGYPHCMADAFFYLCAPLDFWMGNLGSILSFYVCIVFGNFIGCNLYRFIMGSNPE